METTQMTHVDIAEDLSAILEDTRRIVDQRDAAWEAIDNARRALTNALNSSDSMDMAEWIQAALSDLGTLGAA